MALAACIVAHAGNRNTFRALERVLFPIGQDFFGKRYRAGGLTAAVRFLQEVGVVASTDRSKNCDEC